MDESTSSPAPVETDSSVQSMNTTDAPTPSADPQPAGDTPAESDSQPTQPEPTGPAPDTNDPDLPDHGVDPDKGIDPDAGDAPTTPEAPKNEAEVDLKSMTRAERREYFQNIDSQARKQVEASINAAYQPQPVDELTQAYMDEGYDNFQAQILARETVRDQQAQISEARAEIAELNAGLATEAMEVVSTIDWLNPNKGKGVYDQESSDAASQLYEQLCISKDERTGQIIEAKMSPMQFYSLMDNIRSSGSETARLSAQKAAEEQLAAVAPQTSNTNQRETPFDRLSPAEQREKLLAKGYLIT